MDKKRVKSKVERKETVVARLSGVERMFTCMVGLEEGWEMVGHGPLSLH